MLNGYLIDFVVCPIVIALSSKLHFVVKFFLLFFVLVVVGGGGDTVPHWHKWLVHDKTTIDRREMTTLSSEKRVSGGYFYMSIDRRQF
jgi:hypothetical protein